MNPIKWRRRRRMIRLAILYGMLFLSLIAPFMSFVIFRKTADPLFGLLMLIFLSFLGAYVLITEKYLLLWIAVMIEAVLWPIFSVIVPNIGVPAVYELQNLADVVLKFGKYALVTGFISLVFGLPFRVMFKPWEKEEEDDEQEY